MRMVKQVRGSTEARTVMTRGRRGRLESGDICLSSWSSGNFEDFKKEFEAKNGVDSYVAISIKDYENLGKNFAELRRFIEQQKQIILYYEEAVKPTERKEDDGDKE